MEDLGEEGGEEVGVGAGEGGDEPYRVAPDGGLEGGVGVGEAGQKMGEGVRGEGDCHGVELGGGHGEGVAIGEPVEACYCLFL